MLWAVSMSLSNEFAAWKGLVALPCSIMRLQKQVVERKLVNELPKASAKSLRYLFDDGIARRLMSTVFVTLTVSGMFVSSLSLASGQLVAAIVS